MKEKNKELTIMLSQFGRHEFSDRFFSHLKLTSCPYSIVYADGNADGFSKDILKKYQDSLKIHLIEHKQTLKFKDYFSMQVIALRTINTPYVMLCDNDDFIIYSGIEKILRFLQDNPDYVCAGSTIANIEIDNLSTSCYGDQAYIYKKYMHFRNKEPLDSWEGQAKSTFLDFQPNFYNIFKTGALLKIWEEILELDFSDLTIMEFYKQLRAPTMGKQYSDSSTCHYVRQSGTGTWQQDYDFSRMLVYNNLPEDIRKCADKISTVCSQSFRCDYNSLYETILDSYSIHLNRYLPHNVMRYRWPKLFNLKIKIKKVLNKLPFLLTIKFYLAEARLMSFYKRSMGKSYSVFRAEVKKIKNIISDH
jgi:glycosyltransferase domain-containing protein